ncbi:spondin-1-like [Coccinella septempunctata]|uniref:spondin-1-like n=1 Tax=Coccinella septempunctata TaxID=41139 RepID=UPI001D09379C|nr:spondin-1-like [Coccinella septempunctata]
MIRNSNLTFHDIFIIYILMRSCFLFILILYVFCYVHVACSETTTFLPVVSKVVTNSEIKDRDKRDEKVEQNEDDNEDEEEITTEDDNSREKRKKKGPKVWDRWSKWSECSVTCGMGKQTRWRHCIAGDCAPGEKEAQIKTCIMPPC